jgi:hypothetical protein
VEVPVRCSGYIRRRNEKRDGVPPERAVYTIPPQEKGGVSLKKGFGTSPRVRADTRYQMKKSAERVCFFPSREKTF